MKFKHIFLLSVFVASFYACSDNEDNTANNNSETVYLPMNLGDYWVYDIISEQMTNEDSIFVASENVINSNTYKTFGTRDPFYGFYASAMKNNSIRKDGSKLLLSGALNSAALGDFLDIPISLTDFVFFNEDAAENQVLDTETGSVNQTIQDLPITITYTLKSTSMGNLTTFAAPNGETYNNVQKIKVSLELKVDTMIAGIPIPISILATQEVVSSTLYLAQNIGVVHTNTQYQYELNQSFFNNPLIPAPDLGVPTSASFTVTENLTSYNLN